LGLTSDEEDNENDYPSDKIILTSGIPNGIEFEEEERQR